MQWCSDGLDGQKLAWTTQKHGSILLCLNGSGWPEWCWPCPSLYENSFWWLHHAWIMHHVTQLRSPQPAFWNMVTGSVLVWPPQSPAFKLWAGGRGDSHHRSVTKTVLETKGLQLLLSWCTYQSGRGVNLNDGRVRCTPVRSLKSSGQGPCRFESLMVMNLGN